jgi:hypothetical protein
MKPLDEFEGLAVLEAQRPNIHTADAKARIEMAAIDREGREAYKEMGEIRYKIVREGETAELVAALAEVTAKMEVLPGKRADQEAMLETTARALRDLERQIGAHIADNLDVFVGDARAKAAEAEIQLRSVGGALSEALSAWQAATLRWARISRALSEALRQKDADAGLYRDPSHYAFAIKVPVFPFALSGLTRPCRPEAADMLNQPARPDKPREMKRIA